MSKRLPTSDKAAVKKASTRNQVDTRRGAARAKLLRILEAGWPMGGLKPTEAERMERPLPKKNARYLP